MKTHEFILGPVDTDSISFCKQDMTPFTEEEQTALIEEINSYMPEMIKYAHDGYYKTIVVLKAKNYILVDSNGKIKLKGSSIKDQKKEPALKQLMDEVIECLVSSDTKKIIDIYHKYIIEACNVQDIRRWSTKKTVTKSVLQCRTDPEARLNERKVYDAVKNIRGLQEGDKVYIFPCILTSTKEVTTLKNGKVKEKINKTVGLSLADAWDSNEDKEKLVERVVDTMEIFKNILDTSQFVDYTLVKNKPLLENLLTDTK